jgi:hypothetical protein
MKIVKDRNKHGSRNVLQRCESLFGSTFCEYFDVIREMLKAVFLLEVLPEVKGQSLEWALVYHDRFAPHINTQLR